MKAVGRSNCLTVRLTRALMGHVPVGNYRARFHRLLSHCMCGHPFEDVYHIIHLCLLWSRIDRPRARYLLVNFVKFLVKNPRAFEFPGANLEPAEGEVVLERGGGISAAPAPLPTKAHAVGGAAPATATSPPGRMLRATNITHVFRGGALPSSSFVGHPIPGRGGVTTSNSPLFCFSFVSLCDGRTCT